MAVRHVLCERNGDGSRAATNIKEFEVGHLGYSGLEIGKEVGGAVESVAPFVVGGGAELAAIVVG